MGIKKPPSGRSCALAQAALAKLKISERQEKDVAAAAGTFASLGLWRGARGGAIRLIDLERRARFPRVAS